MHISGMTLSEFLASQNMTDAQFAELVNRDRSTVTRWRNGQTRPDWDAIAAIGAVTDGKVSALDFVNAKERVDAVQAP